VERATFLRLLSASGRGSADLIIGPAGQEDPARSRRVVFKIRVRSLEQKYLVAAFGT
jgi:outer membrane protein OmpA-like peptidoglycan-associated protein